MGAFYVVEGIDGSGKSEVGKRLAAKLGAQLFNTPESEFCRLRDYIDNKCESKEAMFLYYAASNFDASEKIRKVLDSGDAVCVRYAPSTLAWHSCALGLEVEHLESMLSTIADSLLVPDMTFYLTVSAEEQRRRIGKRGNESSIDRLLVNGSSARSSFLSAYEKIGRMKRWCGEWHEIDTTKLTEDEVVDEVLRKIKK